jgi:chemotaxis protein methyltransferase CheR
MTYHDDGLSSRDLNRLRRLIYETAGITLSAEKKLMLEGRLKRRMSRLNLKSCSDYCKYLFASSVPDPEEMRHLLDAVTTNKTDFFRERAHFDYLTANALPNLMARNRENRELLIWSAGCSSGEEPYTLAITLNEFAKSHPGFRFRVLATDISTTILEKAETGIYASEGLGPVPMALRREYFMRSRNPESDRMRVVPELRTMVEFRRLNLMEDFAIPEPVDILFCRNVVIYFDRPTQERLFAKFCRQLAPGGYLFVGHSESLHQMDLPLAPIAPAIYRKILPATQDFRGEPVVPEVYLQAGEVHLSRSPAILKTVLGSCVGVTFWSQRLGAGALCHGILPICPKQVQGKEGYRYMDFAIRDLARRFDAMGVLRKEVQVKVFGGADVLSTAHNPARPTVGDQNWHTALDILRAENLEVMASDVGGTLGRSLHFHTETGRVYVRRLSHLPENDGHRTQLAGKS